MSRFLLAGLLVAAAPALLAAAEPSTSTRPATATRPAAGGEVTAHGALRRIMHDGATAGVVELSDLLPDPRLHAVGALADLAGEITVTDGIAWISRPDGPDRVLDRQIRSGGPAACLLVLARVDGWKDVPVEEEIAWDRLDGEIERLARSAGLDPSRPFPFRIEGDLQELEWHVIDGSRLAPGGGHAAHREAAVNRRAARDRATLVGFFAKDAGGVYTHMGSHTHVHAVLTRTKTSGHLDHVTIPAGAILRLPLPWP